MTSKPLVSRTLATLRSAEFGFFGVVVYTRVQTPRFWGHPWSAGTEFRDFGRSRPWAISWLMVGMDLFLFSVRASPGCAVRSLLTGETRRPGRNPNLRGVRGRRPKHRSENGRRRTRHLPANQPPPHPVTQGSVEGAIPRSRHPASQAPRSGIRANGIIDLFATSFLATTAAFRAIAD